MVSSLKTPRGNGANQRIIRRMQVTKASLAGSNFLIPAPFHGCPIRRPIAAARYAVSAEIAKTEIPRGVCTSADFIRTGHKAGLVGIEIHAPRYTKSLL
jgi:hypothetical protein